MCRSSLLMLPRLVFSRVVVASVSGHTCSDSQLAHIKSNQAQHKSRLILSLCPWLLLGAGGIFNWALEAWMCFYLLVFRLFLDFSFLIWFLDHGLGAAASSNLSFYLSSVLRCPLLNQLSLLSLSLFSLPQHMQPCCSVIKLNMVLYVQLKCFLFV